MATYWTRPKSTPQQYADKLSADEAVHSRIKQAFRKVAGNPPMDAARLHHLRGHLSDIPREHVDKALMDMHRSGKAHLQQLDNPKDQKSVGDSAIKSGHMTYHSVWINE